MHLLKWYLIRRGGLGVSGVATGGQGGVGFPLDSKKIAKNWEKEGDNLKKKKEKEGKNWDGSFTLPLLADRAGYDTVRGEMGG